MILLSLPPELWDYRHALSCPTLWGTRDETLGFIYVRQVLCRLSSISSSVCSLNSYSKWSIQQTFGKFFGMLRKRGKRRGSGMLWVGLERAMGLSCTLASGHWLRWNMIIFKAIIDHFNYIADAEMSKGIQKSLQTLRAKVMGVSFIPEHSARSKQANVNKASCLKYSSRMFQASCLPHCGSEEL